MIASRSYPIVDESQGGETRRAVAQICQRIGGGETYCGRVSLVITELAKNLIRHAGGGEILVREIPHPKSASLDILALDTGPGMRNVDTCMRDGYSTGGTAGTGFGSISRLADHFEVFSQPERGTVVWARLCTRSKVDEQFEVSAVNVPLHRNDECGDAWTLHENGDSLRVLVADGLGHGAFAAEASREAVNVFAAQPEQGLPDVLTSINQALTATRGAAGSIVEIQPAQGLVKAVGLGNISMRLLYQDGSKSFSCENGTLGSGVRKIHEFSQPWKPGSLLVMHSDGISTQWNPQDYPGLVFRHPSVVAGVLYRDFRRERDDATVVVARHRP